MSSLSELRSLLHATPSPQRWSALVAHLALWPDPDQLTDEVIPYVHGALARWPDALRVVPQRWLEDALRDVDHPALPICRALTLDEPDDALRAPLSAALARPGLARLTHLTLKGLDLRGEGEVEALLASVPAELPLTCLAVHRFWGEMASLERWLIERLASGELRELVLYENRFDVIQVMRLLKAAAEHGALRRLDLSHQRGEPSIARHFGHVCEALGALQELRDLSLGRLELGPEASALLAQHLAAPLESLALYDNQLARLDLLAHATWWPTLRRLDLSHNHIPAKNCAALCDALRSRPDDAPPLSLVMAHTRLGDRGVEALLPGLGAVGELELSGHCGLYGESLRLLASAPDSLRGLRVALGHSCDEGMAAFAQAALPSLRSLTIESPMMGEPGVAALLASSSLTGLVELELRGTWSHNRSVTMVHDRMDAAEAARWAPGEAVARLESLTLEWAALPEPALGALLASPQLGGLRALDVRSASPVTHLIAQSRSLGGLERLTLSHNGSSAAGTRALLASDALGALHELKMWGEGLDDAMLDVLSSGAGLPALERLELPELSPSASAWARLLASARLGRLAALTLRTDQLDVMGLVMALGGDGLRPELRWALEQVWSQRVTVLHNVLPPEQRAAANPLVRLTSAVRRLFGSE